MGDNWYTSATGIGAWTQISKPPIAGTASTTVNSCVSDKLGRVIVSVSSSSRFLVSTDDLATWQVVDLSGPDGLGATYYYSPSYANGRFFIYVIWGGLSAIMCSTDLYAWVGMTEAGMAVGTFGNVAYLNGVYLENSGSGTVTTTFVEDTSKMYLPHASQASGASTAIYSNFKPWIKVR